MKINETARKLIFAALIGCMAFSNMVYAQNTSVCSVESVDAIYLLDADITINKDSGEVNVRVTTSACTSVDYIYHDVSVYKNGVRISWERYDAFNKDELITNIRVAAQSGDYFEVLVDHYTDHLGCLEVMYTSANLTY